MKRYRHYLRRPTRNEWPKNIYCVQPEGNGNAVVQWLFRRGSVYSAIDTNELHGLSEWRRYLSGTIASDGNAVIISWRCNRVWSDLQVWEDIEDGRIAITEDAERRTQAPVDTVRGMRQADTGETTPAGRAVLFRLQKSRSPYLVLEDPPNILGFKVRGRPGKVTWVDVRNYGVELIGGVLSAHEAVYQLSKFVREMSDISEQLSLGSFRPTVASQAMHGWRKSYMPRGVYAHTDKEALRLEDASLYGGRAECFRLGAIPFPVGHYDIRSSYGAVMAKESLPIRLISIDTGPSSTQLVRRCFNEAVIADVTIETDEPAYPYRSGDGVIWPVGRFRTVLPGPELSDAVLQHRVVNVHSAALYESDRATESYAVRVYGARRAAKANGNGLCESWIKCLLVSLAGKLGQRNRQWIAAGNGEIVKPYSQWYATDSGGKSYKCRSVAGRVYREYIDGFAPDAIPAAAAWITSAGRMALLHLVRAAGWANVLYVDTDAVIVVSEGARRLRDSGQQIGEGIGELRAVYRGDSVSIYGIKHYTEGGRVVFGGAPRGTVRDLGDGVHYAHVPAITDELRGGNRPAAPESIRRFPSAATYRLGVVGQGGIVKPHVLREG